MKRLVIANRGEIARRIMRTAKSLGFEVAVVAPDNDRDTAACSEADAVLPVKSYLAIASVVKAAKEWRADLLHPGYGFLSENSEFSHAVSEAEISFVGPTAAQMAMVGSKEGLKQLAHRLNLPTLTHVSSGELKKLQQGALHSLLKKRGITAPYLIKASAGGGGRGMRIVSSENELRTFLVRAQEEAKASFGDGAVFVERYLKGARHIEIQVFGDGKGGGVALGERECSLQRRHQKLIEEAPSVAVDSKLRKKLGAVALAIVHASKYRGAGTVEFLLDAKKNFYLLEVNARLQVEHPVTEAVYGIDLVAAQLSLACGSWPKELPAPHLLKVLEPKGAAIELRIIAEDPTQDFAPSPGKIVGYKEPAEEGVRFDSGVRAGDEIKPHFDSLIAKLIVQGRTREEARQSALSALLNCVVHGPKTNLSYLAHVVAHRDFKSGRFHTAWIGEHHDQLIAELGEKDLISHTAAVPFCRALFAAVRNAPNQAHCFSTLSGKWWPAYGEKRLTGVELLRVKEQDGVITFRYKGEPLYVTQLDSAQLVMSYQGVTKTITDPAETLYHASGDGVASKGEVYSPLPGKVHQVLVKQAQNVAQGDPLFVIESMKMQIEVKAPCGGCISQISVRAGESVGAGGILATVEVEQKRGR